MTAHGPGPPPDLAVSIVPSDTQMPNAGGADAEGSHEPTATLPCPADERSELPQGGCATPSSGTLPDCGTVGGTTLGGTRDIIAEPSTPDGTSHPLHERDHELITFLVRKAIEKCLPSSPDPSLSMRGARQRSTKRNA